MFQTFYTCYVNNVKCCLGIFKNRKGPTAQVSRFHMLYTKKYQKLPMWTSLNEIINREIALNTNCGYGNINYKANL